MADFTLDPDLVQRLIDQAVEKTITTAIDQMVLDPVWLQKVERLINQTVAQHTVQQIGNMDINTVIKERVDENMQLFRKSVIENFASTGISDQSTSCQLTILDDTTVVENKLTVRDFEAVESAVIKDLVVKGSINTDNHSWNELSDHISNKTLQKLTDEWRDGLVSSVGEYISANGINFLDVKVNGQTLIQGSKLAGSITESNIQKVGVLQNLTVSGETHLNNDTVSVLNKRLGVNTAQPEAALSVWDEEVSIILGKHKESEAYIGTSRLQSLVIGVNRNPQIEVTVDGLTKIKQLQIGNWRVMHHDTVPGWSGTRGDIVFNTNPTPDGIFGWNCIGGYKWQVLKSAA